MEFPYEYRHVCFITMWLCCWSWSLGFLVISWFIWTVTCHWSEWFPVIWVFSLTVDYWHSFSSIGYWSMLNSVQIDHWFCKKLQYVLLASVWRFLHVLWLETWGSSVPNTMLILSSCCETEKVIWWSTIQWWLNVQNLINFVCPSYTLSYCKRDKPRGLIFSHNTIYYNIITNIRFHHYNEEYQYKIFLYHQS